MAQHSGINREESLRQYINDRLQWVENYAESIVTQLAKAVVDCPHWRDKYWENEMTKLERRDNTPKVSIRPPRHQQHRSDPSNLSLDILEVVHRGAIAP